MAVAVIQPRGEKESTLDKLTKGLNIASSVLGIGVNLSQLSQNKEIKDLQVQKLKDEQQGVMNQSELAKLVATGKVRAGKEGEQGGFQVNVRSGDGQVSPLNLFVKEDSSKLLDSAVKQQQFAINKEKLGQMERDRLVPGLGLANTKEGAAKIKDLKRDMDAAQDSIEQLAQIADTPGKKFDLRTRAKADQLQKTLIGQLRIALTGPGALSDSERQLIEGAIANPTDIFSLDTTNRQRLSTLKNILDRKVALAAQSEGINAEIPEAPGLEPAPQGGDVQGFAKQVGSDLKGQFKEMFGGGSSPNEKLINEAIAKDPNQFREVNGVLFQRTNGGWQRL